jgi:hypothetical protein
VLFRSSDEPLPATLDFLSSAQQQLVRDARAQVTAAANLRASWGVAGNIWSDAADVGRDVRWEVQLPGVTAASANRHVIDAQHGQTTAALQSVVPGLAASARAAACTSVDRLLDGGTSLGCPALATFCTTGDASRLGASAPCRPFELKAAEFTAGLDDTRTMAELTSRGASPSVLATFKAEHLASLAAYQPTWDAMWSTPALQPAVSAVADVTTTATGTTLRFSSRPYSVQVLTVTLP